MRPMVSIPWRPGHAPALGQDETAVPVVYGRPLETGPSAAGAIGSLAAGAGIAYASTYLPGDLKAPAVIAGLAIGAYGGYNAYRILSGALQGFVTDKPEEWKAIPPTQNPSDAAFVRAEFLRPKDGGVAERDLFRSSYPVEVQLTNPLDRSVTIQAQIEIEESASLRQPVKVSRPYIVEIPAKSSVTYVDEDWPVANIMVVLVDAVGRVLVRGDMGETPRIATTAMWSIK